LFSTTTRRALEQVGVVGLELGAQRLEVGDGVVGEVDDEGQQAGARDVPQELEAQAPAEVRVLDDAGHVGDREALMVALDHAEVGAEGREGVGGHLRPGVRQGGQQARLAGVGVADEADVGDRAQLEPQPALLAGRAVLGEARRAAVGVGEGGVAAAADAAGGDQRALAHLDEVGEHLAGVGVGWRRVPTGTGIVTSLRPGPRGCAPRPARSALVDLPGHQPVERGDVVDGLEPHAAAVAAVAAVGAALGDVLQAHERHGAVAALAALDGDLDDVTEGHGGAPHGGGLGRAGRWGRERARGPGVAARAGVIGRGPSRSVGRGSRQSADTAPARSPRRDEAALGALVGEADDAVAQGEDGEVLAEAGVEAGLELGAALAHQDVAGGTTSPSKRFTPRRLDWLSRPFLELPTPFL
jgi:hypothetical protein